MELGTELICTQWLRTSSFMHAVGTSLISQVSNPAKISSSLKKTLGFTQSEFIFSFILTFEQKKDIDV